MFKTLRLSFFALFTLAFFTARGQFAAGDRLANSSLWFDFSKYGDMGNTSRILGYLNPQIAIFASPNISIGFGMLLTYDYDKSTFSNIAWTTKHSKLDFTPQIFAQYYYPIQGAWYAALKLQIEPSEVVITGGSITVQTTGKKSNSPVKAEYIDYFRSKMRPIVGYRVAKKWLLEAEVASLNFSRYKKLDGTYKSSSYDLNFRFDPSQFTFRWIYFVQNAPLSTKSKNNEK
jgi:hypothetical protein